MDISIATNNGEIGGGEVMLFNIARAARASGHNVTIVAPADPGEVAEAAQDEGFDTVVLPVKNRKQYMAALRVWDARQRSGLLWCNGLVPAAATAGHSNRVVHLHQIPRSTAQKLLVTPARRGALTTLLPSNFAAKLIKGSEVFYNWVEETKLSTLTPRPTSTVRVGFIGRPSAEKGTDVLAEAIEILNSDTHESPLLDLKYELVIAGEPKFVEETSSQQLNNRLEELGDSVKILGWVPPSELLQQVDMLVVPSVIAETFGLVATEAMSARVPVVVTDAGALPEIVGPRHPWIARNADPRHLAELIQQVAEEVTTSSPLLEESVNVSRQRWQEMFSPEAGRQRLVDILNRLS